MPRKRNVDSRYGEKLITLFVKLMFSGSAHSLTRLAGSLDCSKQTVLRLLADIEHSYGARLGYSYEGRQKLVRMARTERRAETGAPTAQELEVLRMCRDFTSHLLGRRLFDEATRALLKSGAAAPGAAPGPAPEPFAAFLPGSIDYTPHGAAIHAATEAIRRRLVCKVRYKSIQGGRAKDLHVAPLKLFSHRDTIYLHGQLIKVYPGIVPPMGGVPASAGGGCVDHTAPHINPHASPQPQSVIPLDEDAPYTLLAVHRIRAIEQTQTRYTPPAKYDFDKVFNREFGVIKGEPFEVVVELTGWAARYAAERTWSPDQKIEKLGRGKIRLTFTASSEPEVIGWVLSLAAEARLLKPSSLVKTLAAKIAAMAQVQPGVSRKKQKARRSPARLEPSEA